MAGSALLLTITTLLGLIAGFAREMLLIAKWGAGEKTDAFLVAMFLPDMLRTMLASGLLASAALPLLGQQQTPDAVRQWARAHNTHFIVLSLGLSLVLFFLAPLWVSLIGPGLSPTAHDIGGQTLHVLAWCVPGLLIHAYLSLFFMSHQKYGLIGLGSLLFNAPAVLYLLISSDVPNWQTLAGYFVLGSVLMPLVLIPKIKSYGWSQGLSWHAPTFTEFYRKLGPLLLSTLGSNGLTLIERIVASHLGEGAITLVNLARKLVGLPLVALMSLSQVVLAQMAKQQQEKLPLLRSALKWASIIAIPSAIGLSFGAHALIQLGLPKKLDIQLLALLLSIFSLTLVIGSWNALLARYFYAEGDTKTPLIYELTGNAVNAILAFALVSVAGIAALPLAASVGVLTTACLMFWKTKVLSRPLGFAMLHAMLVGVMILAWHQWQMVKPLNAWYQIAVATGLAVVSLITLALIYRPWQTATAPSATLGGND